MARPPYWLALAATLASAIFAGCFAGLDDGALTGGAGAGDGGGPGPGAGHGDFPTQGMSCDDFSGDAPGGAPAGWSFDGGTWTVAALGSAHALAQTDDHPSQRAYAIYGQPSWQDYTVALTVTPSQTSSSDCLDGRWQDQDHHYSLCLRDGNSWSLAAYDRSGRNQLASGSFDYSAGDTHVLELAFHGRSITPRLDGDAQDPVSDDTVAGGQVGLSTSNPIAVTKICVTLP